MTEDRTLDHLALAGLLLTYLVLAVGYSLANPLYESTDELRHVRYFRHIATYRNLPVQRADGPRAQSHHPPLYYALGALVAGWIEVEQDVYYQPKENPFWAYRHWEVSNDNKNQYVHGPRDRVGFVTIPTFDGITLSVYLVRWMTVLIGAGVVWLTHCIGESIFPGQTGVALGGAALVAFNPQFLYLSGAVNNDVPAALCGAAVLLMCVRLIRQGPSLRADVTLGILFGLSLLTKFHLLALLAPITTAYVLGALPKRNWRHILRGAVVVVALATIVSGWWFLRNWRLYGDPTGLNRVNQLWAGRSPGGNWWVISQKLPYLWSTFWGRFGYGQVPLPAGIYRGLLVFCAVAVAGYLVPGRRRFRRSAALIPVAATSLIFIVVVVYYMLIQPAGAMGRFLFPALPAFGILLIGGLSRFFPLSRGTRWVSTAVIALTAIMVSLAIYALVGVLAPAFAPPRDVRQDDIESIPNRMEVVYGDTVQLLGYRIEPEEVQPGDAMSVTLYWRPLRRTQQEYAVFVHVMSDVGVMIAQRDTYPGLGRYPTTAWDPGVIFADTYRVEIPETAYSPDEGYVQVGLYLPDGPRLAADDGRDAVKLCRVRVDPRPGEVPNPLYVNFGGKIAVRGYALEPRAAEAGETVRLHLYWDTLAPMDVDYHVFAHVLGEENQIWANSDSRIMQEGTGTSEWGTGSQSHEVRELTLSESTPQGFYDIELGVHVPGDGRLKVMSEDGRPQGNRKFLAKIRVVGRNE